MKNPYAYVNDSLVVASRELSKKQDFICPNCKKQLILKCGDIVSPHFAHKANMSDCSPDRITHSVAIDCICSGKEFKYTFHCRNNASELDISYEYGRFFKKGDNTECEHYVRENIKTIGGMVASYTPTRYFGGNNYTFKKEYSINKYSADIAVFLDGKLKGVIEVCNTHSNEPEKVSYYKNNNIVYIEVDAQSVIDSYKDNTFVNVIDTNLSNFISCTTCRKINRVLLLMKYNDNVKMVDG